MRLHLIRHPRPEVGEGICYGRSDLPLADAAELSAPAIAAQFPAGIPVFSSPLMRCRQLAEALHHAPVIDERLVEMDFGAWEHRAWSAIAREEIDAWAADPLGFVPPGGEAVDGLLARARQFLDHLDASGIAEAAAVTHAGVIKAIHGVLGDLPPRQWMRLAFEFGSVTTVSTDG